jgi:cell division protein ZapE
MFEINDHDNPVIPLAASVPGLSPRQRYDRDLAAELLLPDRAQSLAIDQIESVFQEIVRTSVIKPQGLLRKIFDVKSEIVTPVRGLYLWGSVGRGKTYIVDAFFDCLTTEQKLRIHFHSFMRKVHSELRQLSHESDPLALIAKRWASQFRVLCLDEFHVGDITDAMILGNILRALFDNGVSLITTSNEAPGNLYRDGLQRERFLPAIALLEQHLEIFELTGDLDYRLRALEQAGVYYTPHDEFVDASLKQCFAHIAPSLGIEGGSIEIDGREIPTLRHADGVVWFDFATLCGGARSTGDYIEISLCHHTIVLSDIPVMDKDSSDAARRFINLIDELYDRNVKLILSAAKPAEDLYTGTRLVQPYKRTASRLREMQSHDYLARPHLCD